MQNEIITRVNGRAIAVDEGSVILTPAEAAHFADNVLPVYRDAMVANARTMRETAQAIESQPKQPQPKAEHGLIDVTPTNAGAFYGLANEFDRYVNRAQEQMAELQGGDA